MKKISTIIKVVLSLFLAAAILFALIFFLAFGGGEYFLPNPPKPEITYGEFPFKLTYELDGETKVIEDTLICEFDGFRIVGEAGTYRQWKSYLKSGSEEITLLDLRPLEEINEFGQTMLELFFYWGNAEYYMGDNFDGRWKDAQDFNWVDYKYQDVDGSIGGSAYKAEVAWEKYKIKLISWEVSDPIVNSFK